MIRFLVLLIPAALSAQATITLSAFEDRNGNGARDAGDRLLPNVVFSNQRDVERSGAAGTARIERGPSGIVFVSLPNGYRSVGPFWRAPAPGDSSLSFALQRAPAPRTFSFVHASDPHIAPASVDRTRRFRKLVDSLRPDFTIVTGDLIRDAMSQQEPLARSYFELFDTETRGFAKPVWTVPGNHDHFGIIRSRSHVPETHPLYDRAMYRLYRGPDYYSFTFGGVHFVGLNTLMTDDSAYYGRVDTLQLAWLKRDLEMIPANMPVVTFNHIPMVSAWEILIGFTDMPLVGSARVDSGKITPRHMVANTLDVVAAMRGHRWVVALGGHMHTAEKIVFQLDGERTRFEQAAALIGGNSTQDISAPSGFTLYTVRDGVIDAGRFIRMDPRPPASDRGR